jgi:hypothetical protein
MSTEFAENVKSIKGFAIPLELTVGVLLAVGKMIYKQVGPWLKEQAAKSDTPIDDWMLVFLDAILGDSTPKTP